MALVWFKSIDRIIEEGGEAIEGYDGRYFYDQRASDSMTVVMTKELEDSLGPYRSKNPSSGFKAPTHFRIVGDGYNWYSPWVKLWIPTGFVIKRRL